jgi:RNA-directed DNA polymerase
MFAFADSPSGGRQAEALSALEGKAWLLHRASVKKEESSPARAAEQTQLLESVASPGNLIRALLKVARNKGAPGVDRRSVKEVVASARLLLPKLRSALLSGRYRPGDIRRVWIPKPGGGQRGLGIPNVVDRWIQQAVLQVLEPIFEPTFHDNSHGFRANRGAHTAIAEAKRHVEEGFDMVVDIDLSKFFDRVNHQRLLNRLAQRIKDGRILKLVHQMLKAKVVMPDGVRVSVEEGTPQGGPLSPLLSNVVLDELDWELERRGLRFVRYADDCNIFVLSERAGHRVMNSTRRFIESRLRLKLNEEKSSVDHPENLHFLGFRLWKGPQGQVEVGLSVRTQQRLSVRIRELTPRTWGRSLEACMESLNQYLRGWSAYFRICTEAGARFFERYDARVRRRLRAIIVRQKKRPRHLLRHLLSRGVPLGLASKAAFSRCGIWPRSAMFGIHKAYPNAWFAERLVLLKTTWHKLNQPRRVSGQQLLLFDLTSDQPEEPDVRPTSPVL